MSGSDSLGQLSPSKSIGGFRVYGLAGRLVEGGVGGGASSLGSLAASVRCDCDAGRVERGFTVL